MNSYKNVKEKLNNTSCSLCLAKWTQVTLHLQIGQTHSCHHPKTHKIPLEEIANNPSALHNTNFKKEQRKLMLEGERPTECDYCWTVEDSDKKDEVFSDRITKSAEDWSLPYYDKIINSSHNKDINPTYLEVSFSNVCNFKCSYCSPSISSKWMEEIKQYGGYPTRTSFNNLETLTTEDRVPIPHNQQNPYVEAFWKWWPDLYQDLKVFRITGGEPLLSKDTFKVLDYIIENPNPNLELCINSNLVIPPSIFNNFVEKMKRIQGEGLVKNFKLYTSCEASGKRAEYIRFGFDYNKWKDNCFTILNDIPDSRLTNMATYNALSVTTYKDMLNDMLEMRNHFKTKERITPITFDTAYLRWPWHQSIFILDASYRNIIRDTVTHMYQNKEVSDWIPLTGKGFYDFEINRMRRIYHVFDDKLNGGLEFNKTTKKDRFDFYKFVNEHDRRRGTNFLKTFPEMELFYYYAKESLNE